MNNELKAALEVVRKHFQQGIANIGAVSIGSDHKTKDEITLWVMQQSEKLRDFVVYGMGLIEFINDGGTFKQFVSNELQAIQNNNDTRSSEHWRNLLYRLYPEVDLLIDQTVPQVVNPSPIPSQQENPAGFHVRFLIQKADGSEIDPNAEYFVLRLDRGGSDQHNIKACRSAIMAYAIAIAPTLPVLALDLLARYGTNEMLYSSTWRDALLHMLINIARWNELAAAKEIENNMDHWVKHYNNGLSPLEAYNYDLNESSHHA